ncbi:hypothetical protein [uncultured Akkermansia sp.]|uniref:hypothetical protein n=1 Tax=uncultured Akkermansia sp. TaxID=512294 RepID=UPI0026043461|nr:hypothetical protein [uncultured Akkermansia sp.]
MNRESFRPLRKISAPTPHFSLTMNNRFGTACLLFLLNTAGSSCRENTAGPCTEAQYEATALRDITGSPVRAEQHADKPSAPRGRTHGSPNTMRTEEKRRLWGTEAFRDILFRKEPLKNNFPGRNYCGFQKPGQVQHHQIY